MRVILRFGLCLLAFLSSSLWAAGKNKSVDPAVAIWDTLSKADPMTGKAPKEVSKLVGKKLDVAGYMIINELDSTGVTEFLLARVPSGCVHVPPPPANNIIHVQMQNGKTVSPQMSGQIRVTGTLSLGGRVDAVYEMKAEEVRENK